MNYQMIGIAGLGLLGRGIAACCLSRGLRVVGFTRHASTHETARKFIGQAIGDLVQMAAHPQDLLAQWQDNFVPATSLGAFSAVDFVIETVVEDLGVKNDVFDRLEEIVGPEVPIGTNTSAIPISILQKQRKHPERFLGMHWSENAHATRFLELIRGESTSEAVFQSVADFARQIGREPALVQKDIPAFICNRLGYAMYREAIHLLESGVADVETIDRSARNAFGLWAAMCGPFRWMDLSGGPALYARAMRDVLPSLCNATELPTTLQKMVAGDARGVSNNVGFYDYQEGDWEVWKEHFRAAVWHVKAYQDRHFPLDHDDT